jgi:hypothetical protein
MQRQQCLRENESKERKREGNERVKRFFIENDPQTHIKSFSHSNLLDAYTKKTEVALLINAHFY